MYFKRPNIILKSSQRCTSNVKYILNHHKMPFKPQIYLKSKPKSPSWKLNCPIKGGGLNRHCYSIGNFVTIVCLSSHLISGESSVNWAGDPQLFPPNSKIIYKIDGIWPECHYSAKETKFKRSVKICGSGPF